LQRSEMKAHDELKDSISSSLMMMWSVTLTGSKPLKVPSKEAIKACQDLQSSPKNIEKTETVLNFQRDYLEYINLGLYHPGVNGALPQRIGTVSITAQSIISKLVTWLLKLKRFGK